MSPGVTCAKPNPPNGVEGAGLGQEFVAGDEKTLSKSGILREFGVRADQNDAFPFSLSKAVLKPRIPLP